MRRSWLAAVVVVAAGCAVGVGGAASSASAGGCGRYTQAASPQRPGYTRTQVERAFGAEGFQLGSSLLSYAFPGQQAIRCHLMLADELLYTGGQTGPCLYVYLFPHRLGQVPESARKGFSCGDGSGRPEPGLRAGTARSGSLLIWYRLGPSGVARMRAAMSRLSGR